MSKKIELKEWFEEQIVTLDQEWLVTAFVPPREKLKSKSARRKIYSSADSKFTDTTLGGNLGINNKPQYTRYCDPRRVGVGEDTVEDRVGYIGTNIGMGSYYSMAHDDNNQILSMEFGVPKFQSIFSLFTRAISYPESVMVNEGRYPLLYHVGDAIGTASRFRALPIFSIALVLAKLGTDILAGAADTRYFTMKPTMHMYWTTVNTLVNNLAVSRGISRVAIKSGIKDRIGNEITVTDNDLEALHELNPNIVTKDGYIDAFAISAKTAMRVAKRIDTQRDNIGSVKDADEYEFSKVPRAGKVTIMDLFNQNSSGSAFKEHEKKPEETGVAESGNAAIDKKEIDADDPNGRKLRIDTDDGKEDGDTESYFQSVWNYFNASASTGGNYARFNVDYIGSTTMSVSNSLKDPGIKAAFNGISGTVRDAKFSTAGGAVLGQTVDSIVSGAKDILAGLSNGLSAGLSNVLIGLLGGGYLDVPQMWDDSTVQLNQQTFEMTVIAPYAHPISLFMNLDFVLAMLLAGTLPRSTGETSYGSPFLCSAYLRGIIDTDLAMITSLDIEAGVTNTPRNMSGAPMSLKIRFTVTDLSTISVSPTPTSFGPGFEMSLDDTKPLNRYFNALTGRDFYQSKFIKPSIMNRLANLERDVESYLSPARLGLFLSDSFLGDIRGAFGKDIVLG